MLEYLLIPILIVLGFIVLVLFVAAIAGKGSKDESEGKPPFGWSSSIKNCDKLEQEAFGKKGENYVANMLEDLANTYNGHVFNDFTFKDEAGFSTNIDHIFISRGGIFIIETKSNKGIIYGNTNDETWYAQKEDWQDDRIFKNPIKQNQGHINHLRKMMGKYPPKMISIVIFPFAEQINSDSETVFDIEAAKQFIIEKTDENDYSENFPIKMCKKIQEIIDIYGITIEEHKENIKSKYNN